MHKSTLKSCLLLSVAFLLLSTHFVDSRPQFWSRIRETIFGKQNENEGGGSGGPSQPPQQSQCDKGQSYSPDNCNRCVCVGSTYRCTLKYCDPSLANLPAFKFD